MNKLSLLKLVLALIAIYHLVLGLATFVSDDLTARLAWQLFGLNLEMTPQLSYIVQLLGVYAITFGVLTAFVARDPLAHRAMLNVVLILYVLRIVNKFLSMGEFTQAFNASTTRIWTDLVLLAFFGAAVLLLRPASVTPRHA
jgi:hypothetical protein